MLALGWFGFGLRPAGGLMRELRLGLVRFRVAVPETDTVVTQAVARARKAKWRDAE
jgi:hypothetical protein